MDRTPHGTAVLVPDVVDREKQHAQSAYRFAKGGWLAQYPEHTRNAYKRELELLEAWAASFGVDPFDLRLPQLQMYVSTFEHRQLSPSTQNAYITAIQSFYRYCCDEVEVLERNPAAKIRRPKWDDDDVHRPVLTRPQGAKFLATAEAMPERYRDRDFALACLLLLNGLRVSAVISINIDTINVNRGHDTVNVRSKGGKYATVPLAPTTRHAVQKYAGDRTDGPLFLDSHGGRLSTWTARKRIRIIGMRAGLGPVTPHALRRTAITEALAAGTPLRDVQLMAQHASADTTGLYDRRRKSLDRNPTYTLGNWFSGG